MTSKPKVAICWFGACGGCDETILDLNEEIVKVVELFEIVLWPVALDFKYKDIERMQDKEIAASIINGCVRNSEHKELAHLLRQKSEIVVAFGACACFGGTPSLANLASKESIFSFVYKDSPTAVNPSGLFPKKELKENGKELTLPEFFDKVEPLNRVIDVDYYLPGCPPHPDLVVDMFNVLASGDLPPKGSTLSPPHALCAYCERNTTKPEVLRIKTLKRIHEVGLDSGDCFLAQGIICLGPATRSGCGTPCMKVNVPCRGCMGPVGGVRDPGTRYISTIASLVDAGTDESIREVLNGMRDAAGYLYRVRLTHLRKVGWNGLNEGEGTSLYRVGPLGRFNVCEGMATPLAQKEYEYMVSVLGKPCHLTMAYHWARLLEALQAAEEIYVIAKDPLLTGKDIRNTNFRMIGKGVGCVEACRGVLIHDYETDNQGLATKINLIVATQHNAAPICLSVKKAAKEFIKDGKVLNKDGLLNMVEMAFRAYDPCLGCATHTIGWRDLLIINVRNIFYTVRTFHSKEQFTLRTLLREMKNVSEKITGNARFTQKAVS